MDCIRMDKHGAEILTDYCAGTLDPARSAAVEAHTRDCAECRRLVEAQRSVWETLDRWKPAVVSPDFDAKLYARIAAECKPSVWLRWRKAFLPLAAACAALLVALAVRAPEWNRAVPDRPSAQVQPGSTDLDQVPFDQVQQTLDDLNLLTPLDETSSVQTPASKL
jgi:anti-sigma factor RsiW